MRNHNRNTKPLKHSLLLISNENFVLEGATESSSGKKVFLNLGKILEKVREEVHF